jgi:hypothetical protein
MPALTLDQSRAATALRESPLPPLRKLLVEETDSTVMILGDVPSYYYKQQAQETVRPTLAGRKLVNRVAVVG